MNIRVELHNIISNSILINIEEKFVELNSDFTINDINLIDINSIKNISENIPIEDSFEFVITIGQNDSLILGSTKNDFTLFEYNFNEEKKYYENETIHISFKINKSNLGDKINIYDFNAFNDFIKLIDDNKFLDLLSQQLKNRKSHFRFVENNHEEFGSKVITFGYKASNIFLDNILEKQKEICHFGNFDTYSFVPAFFNLINRPIENNPITDKLDRLTIVFSLINIFDISSLNDNNLYLKLNGFKVFEGHYPINDIDLTLKDQYIEIYDWIYSEPTKAADKIGLARNIISLYFNQETLAIDKSVYISILSSYKTYIKENINRYIEIRNKIHDDLKWMTQKSSEMVEKYLNNYLKSNFAFITFFITVFLIKVINSGNYTNIFTKDITFLSFAFIGISVVTFIISLVSLNIEKRRYKRKYENIKSRFRDLLIQEDIDRILNNDNEFLFECNYIKSRRTLYSILWILTILILSLTIIILSTCTLFSKNLFYW